MEFNAKNFKKVVEAELQKVVDEVNAELADEQEAALEEYMAEQEGYLGRNCHILQRKACHLEARNELIMEFRKKGYLSPKFFQSKDWLSLAFPKKRKLP